MRSGAGYEFKPPTSLKEAKERLRTATIDIMNVEKQLGDRRRQVTMKNYDEWRERTKAAKIFTVMEQKDLKAWIFERRRQLDARDLGVWPPADPRVLLQQVVLEGRRELRGETSNLAGILDLIDTYLTHDA